MSYLYKEITQWDTPKTPNHVYIFEDKLGKRSARAIGYVKQNSEDAFWFSKPMVLDLKDRKFVQVGTN